jgi:hypothetical protein
MSRKAADQLPTWQVTLRSVCFAVLSVGGAAAICMLIFHTPWAGPFGIGRWLLYGVFYVIFFTGFSLLKRHMRMRGHQLIFTAVLSIVIIFLIIATHS